MKHSLSISPKACGIVLATFAVMMNLAATVADIVTQRVRNENMWPVCRQFTFTTEGNLANLYQGLQLLFCAALIRLEAVVAANGNQNAASDVHVAGLLARAALKGAQSNVEINLPGITDPAIAASLKSHADQYATALA